MIGHFTQARRLAAIVTAAIVLAGPARAGAQDVPSYAQPPAASTDETIHGRIRSVDGAFSISVADDRGFVDNVELHQGTIINPTGLTLGAGMSVTIQGYNAGASFTANEIDTPYSYAGPLPTPVYYGAGYWCPGFAYGYGPSFTLAIVFGGGYRPWYYEHEPFYGRPWNGHGYFGGYVGVAPLEVRGGQRRALGGTTAHPPSAFAGRTFAGESRNGYTQAAPSHVFSAQTTGRGLASPGDLRAAVPPGSSYSRGAAPAVGTSHGDFARSAPAGGGGARASAPAHGGGGGHGH